MAWLRKHVSVRPIQSAAVSAHRSSQEVELIKSGLFERLGKIGEPVRSGNMLVDSFGATSDFVHAEMFNPGSPDRILLQKAVISLLSDLSERKIVINDEQIRDLFVAFAGSSTIFGTPTDPRTKIDLRTEDLEEAVSIIVNLAKSDNRECALSAQVQLASLKEPKSAEFWLDLYENAKVKPYISIIFEALMYIDVKTAFEFIEARLMDGSAAKEAKTTQKESSDRFSITALTEFLEGVSMQERCTILLAAASELLVRIGISEERYQKLLTSYAANQ